MSYYPFQPTCQIPPDELDKVYVDSFGMKNNGLFVEVGAHDGWHWSCTWGLAEIGWNGIYIEPVPELYRECVKTNAKRPNTICVQCCVGAENKKNVTLYMGPYGASLDKAYASYEEKKTGEKYFTEIKSDQYTLDHLLNAFGIKPQFDLLVIDVEFAEDQVLAGFSVEEWLPTLIVIETQDEKSIAACKQYLNNRYEVVYHDWINSVYRRTNESKTIENLEAKQRL